MGSVELPLLVRAVTTGHWVTCADARPSGRFELSRIVSVNIEHRTRASVQLRRRGQWLASAGGTLTPGCEIARPFANIQGIARLDFDPYHWTTHMTPDSDHPTYQAIDSIL
jgi:hypothetical protein